MSEEIAGYGGEPGVGPPAAGTTGGTTPPAPASVRNPGELERELAKNVAERLKRRVTLAEVIGRLPLGTSKPCRRRQRLGNNRAPPGPK